MEHKKKKDLFPFRGKMRLEKGRQILKMERSKKIGKLSQVKPD